MIPFDYDADAELFPSQSRRPRKPIGYKRFARAADAIRFAIEDLPANLLVGTWLKVGEDRFSSADIRSLYDDDAYPLHRGEPATMPPPAPRSSLRDGASLTKRPLWWSRS